MEWLGQRCREEQSGLYNLVFRIVVVKYQGDGTK